ncbi:DUF4265 domain-containing protein [Streptomyces thermolilacinus]|uniref:DUF4265 domain-containing protein n=1 Tax=Streptomyces thermolilacinus SPC6 TaxID=1306406 RepID=A0A1D3DR11_9ACTN|nr:DUF4265 domain-containing protein [Streptomyces thermolilacinus]OEJ94750.1 hypothetical protein J116_009950 [Streptomyces thermolilacinus SPC6]
MNSDPGSEIAGDRIKVWFRFVPREGWLPQDTEGLWATRLGADTARVDNVPFLQDGVAQGDVVRFRTDDEGLHWATGRVSASGNCTVRVLPVASGPLGRSPRAVHQRLAEFQLGGEVFSDEFPLVAFDVSAGTDFGALKLLLVRGQDEGWWHFEVGSGTEAFWNA